MESSDCDILNDSWFSTWKELFDSSTDVIHVWPEISYTCSVGERIHDRLNYLWSVKSEDIFHPRYIELLANKFEAFRHEKEDKFFVHSLVSASYQCTQIDCTATGKLVCARCDTHNCVHTHAVLHHMKPYGKYAINIGRTCLAISDDSITMESSIDEQKCGSDFASDVVLGNNFQKDPRLNEVVENVMKHRGVSPYVNHATVDLVEDYGFAMVTDNHGTTTLSFRKLAFGGTPIINCRGNECQESEKLCIHVLALVVHLMKLQKCEDIVQHTMKLFEVNGIEDFSGFDWSIDENSNSTKDFSCLSGDFSDMSLVDDVVGNTFEARTQCDDTHNHVGLESYNTRRRH